MNNVRSVVLLVGSALVLGVLGIIVLAATDHAIPDVLQNVTVGALTGLVGLLVRPGSKETRDGDA